MQKAIYIERTGKQFERVLSIAEPEIIEANPTGRSYTLIDNYIEQPEVENPSLDIAYPMYDTVNNLFKWVVVHYQPTATDYIMNIENMKAEISRLNAEKAELQDTIDTLLMDSLSGN